MISLVVCYGNVCCNSRSVTHGKQDGEQDVRYIYIVLLFD